MSDAINLQDAILKEVRRDKVPVTLFLMNGFQLRGIVTGFDSFVVVLVSEPERDPALRCYQNERCRCSPTSHSRRSGLLR